MMKKSLLMMTLSSLILMSCGNAESNSTPAATSSSAESSNTQFNMKSHDDALVSFQYPKDWNLNLLKLQSEFDGATQYQFTDAKGNEIFNFSTNTPSSYTLGKASLEEFLEYNNPEKYEILSKESFKTASGEAVYYFVNKRTDDYHNDVRILIPGTDKYEINGVAHNKKEAFDNYVNTGAIIELLKSLKIKIN